MNVKENKFGVIAVLLGVSLWVWLILAAICRSPLLILLLPFTLFILPLASPVFAILSLLKREKRTYPAIAFVLFAVNWLVVWVIQHSCFLPQSPPLVIASDLLREAYQVPSQLVTSTQSVTFTKDYTLPKKAIVERANIGISEDQICLTLGDFQEMTTSGFESGINENKITYRGSYAKKARISALCYEGKQLPEIVGTGPKTIYKEIKKEWVKECKCVTDINLQKQICCMIALRVVR